MGSGWRKTACLGGESHVLICLPGAVCPICFLVTRVKIGHEQGWNGVPDGVRMELYDEQDSRSRREGGKEEASRILTDAWLLVSVRDIPDFRFNRYGLFWIR